VEPPKEADPRALTAGSAVPKIKDDKKPTPGR